MIVMVLMCFALMKDLRNDPITLRENKGAEILEAAVMQGDEVHDGDFQLELSNVAANEAPPGRGERARSWVALAAHKSPAIIRNGH